MNKILRQSFAAHSWSKREGFIQYLRKRNCFVGLGGQTDANPYWYGTSLIFNQLDMVLSEIVLNKSLKKKRLQEFASECKNDYLSPIVRLLGYNMERFLKKNLDREEKDGKIEG